MPAAGTPGTGQPCPARPRIGVSSCLLGEQVRFNGGHSRCRFLTEELSAHVDWVPCCPEMAIGLGTPRETLRLTTGGRLVNRSGTADHTAAVGAVPLPAGLDGYVFKSRSPTCGVRGIARYRGDGQPADHQGRGVFAQALMAAFPLLPVEEEGRLNDDLLREAFTERVFAAGPPLDATEVGMLTGLPVAALARAVSPRLEATLSGQVEDDLEDGAVGDRTSDVMRGLWLTCEGAGK